MMSSDALRKKEQYRRERERERERERGEQGKTSGGACPAFSTCLGGQRTIDVFNQWLGGDWEFQLLWSSRDGDQLQEKHLGKENLLVLVDVNNCLVGAFSPSPLTGSWHGDGKTFLFRLLTNGQEVTDQAFPTDSNAANATSNRIYFGNGSDFVLDSPSKTLSAYCQTYRFPDGKGIYCQSSSSSCKFNTAEVYELKKSTLLKTPWLPLTWTREEKERLTVSLSKLQLPSGVKIVNVLLVGCTGAGKSSFINSVESSLKERITETAQCGRGTSSLTLKFRRYTPLKLRQIAFWDSMGWDQTTYNTGEFNYMLDGNLPNDMSLSQSITPKSSGFNPKPTLAEEMHVVVMLLPAADALDKKHLDRVRCLRDLSRARELRMVLLVTHVDEYDPYVQKNLKDLSFSIKVKKLIDSIHTETGIPKASIFPIKNYSEELEVSTEVSVLILRALRLIIDRALDTLDSREVKQD